MSRLVLVLAVLLLFGCGGAEPLEPVDATPTGETPSLPLSVVHMADPRIVDQLLFGFHQLEGNAWRWTEKRFAVLLEPPPPVPFHSPQLEFVFTVPQVTIVELGSVTVSASLDGTAVGSMTVSEPQDGIVFTSSVPSDLIRTKPLQAEFTLDKAMPPSAQDGRELGVVAISIALR